MLWFAPACHFKHAWLTLPFSLPLHIFKLSSPYSLFTNFKNS